MELKHKVPCAECPWRKTAAQGWLGGHPSEMYADALANNEVPACHLQDFGPNDARTAMCVGALATAANHCQSLYKTDGGEEARKIVGRREDCFSHVREFYLYHTGNTYIPYLVRKTTC